MAWDSRRPVPWRRLFIEWGVVTTVVVVLFLTAFHDRTPASYTGLVLGGVVYVGLGFVLAKLGSQRKSLSQLRQATAATQAAKASGSRTGTSVGSARARPAPTSRTNARPGQRSRPGQRR